MHLLSAKNAQIVKSQFEALKTAKNRLREKAEEKAGEVKSSLEVAAGAAGAAYVVGQLEGRGHKAEIMSLPVDLVAGGLCIALGVFDAAGKYDEDTLNLGNGIVAQYIGRKMYEMGKAGGAKGNLFGADFISGVDEDLAARVRMNA